MGLEKSQFFLLLLVLLQSDAVCHLEVCVVLRSVYGIAELGSLNLRFTSSGLVLLGGVEEGGGEVSKGVKLHLPEVSCPLCGLAGFPVGREVGFPIEGWCKGMVPQDFPKISFWGVGERSEADGSMVP